jgi:hypothetical protein
MSILEEDGKTSSARVNMFLCTISASALGAIGVWKGLEPLSLSTLCGAFLTVGTAGKVIQKKSEVSK